jgi:hypothetical protein
VLHFNPRPQEGAVVLNSFLDGVWGKEERTRRYPFPSQHDAAFHLRFDVSPKRIEISVDGRRLCRFAHRRPPAAIREVRTTTFLWRLDERTRTASSPSAAPPLANAIPGDGWVRLEENPAVPDPLESFRFFGVLGTWMEEDVVAACVANAFRQGCERVYLVDNGSPDATVERALEAGATLALTFRSDRYDEDERIRRMQSVVDEVSAAEGADHVWWLYFDADEFHHGPGGATVREYLQTLDRRFRIVGARLFNHLPDGEPGYVEGRHPLDCQPLCYEIPFPRCALAHSNHPLQRWDRASPPIVPSGGAHTATCDEPLREPRPGVFFQHFPYREEGFTRRRVEHLFGLDGSGGRVTPGREAHMRARLRSLDAVYGRRWHGVSLFPPCVPGYAVELKPFAEWVGADDGDVARWY